MLRNTLRWLLGLGMAALTAAADPIDDDLAALNSPDLQVQALAIHRLCRQPEARVAAPLLRVIRRHPKQYDEVQSAILAIRDPAVIPPLLPFLTERDVRFRELTARVLVQFDDAQLFDPLRAALSDPSAAVRRDAVAWFTRSRDPRAAAVLAEHQARLEAARAAETAAFRASLDEPDGLARALAQPDPWIRRVAATEAGQRRRAGDYPALFAAVADADRDVRAAVDQAIRGLSDPAAEPHLRALLQHPTAPARMLGLSALVALRGTRAWPEVRTALRDPDGYVRVEAVKAAARLADDQTIDTLIPLLDDPDAGVAAMALLRLQEATGQSYGRNTRAWWERPRLYGVSNAPASRWTVMKLLLLWLCILAAQAWAELAEHIQVGQLRRGLPAVDAEPAGGGRWVRRYARRARVEQSGPHTDNRLFVLMSYLRPRAGAVLYYAALVGLGTAWRIPAAALQRDALVAAGLVQLYLALLARLEEDRFFWWLTLAVSGVVALS